MGKRVGMEVSIAASEAKSFSSAVFLLIPIRKVKNLLSNIITIAPKTMASTM